MQLFSSGELDVLVSTTVIEVGVDVPNATIMVIYDADRFGLSQLHQLRGRVGRGSHQSYCILIADPKSETAEERLGVMTETNDGFEISRRDLELRGPGDFFGTKQSGMPAQKSIRRIVFGSTLCAPCRPYWMLNDVTSVLAPVSSMKMPTDLPPN